MSKNLAIAFGIGIAVIALGMTGVLFMQRGSRMELPGKILKVRTAPLDENSSVTVIDFRVTNPSDVLFMVRSVSVETENKQGKNYLAQVSGEMDLKTLFERVPLLGQKFNDALVTRNRIPPHTSTDRMVAASFQAPEAMLEGRKRFIVRIEEMDRTSFELSER
jgi:hypothetical protein